MPAAQNVYVWEIIDAIHPGPYHVPSHVVTYTQDGAALSTSATAAEKQTTPVPGLQLELAAARRVIARLLQVVVGLPLAPRLRRITLAAGLGFPGTAPRFVLLFPPGDVALAVSLHG